MTHPHDATDEVNVAETQKMKEEDDSGNDASDEDDDDAANDEGDGGTMLGGAIDSPAFCLLAGMEETGKVWTKCQFPITRLPATLGRTHAGGDANFVPLGASKALSRNHFLITYRDVHGGELVGGCDATEEDGDLDGNGLVHRPKKRSKTLDEAEGSEAAQDTDDPELAANIIRPSDRSDGIGDEGASTLPEGGFFAIQCLGKNKVVVGGRTVQKGQVALLRHGTTIHLASHWLYFLLPTASSTETMEVPNPAYEAYRDAAARRARLSASTSKDGGEGGADVPRRLILSGSMTTKDLEKIPVETLLQTQTDAIEADQWDRKMQMIGTAISLRAVRDSARSRELRDIARKEGGVARADVMQWIAKKPLYAEWVRQMLSKMELKSYQSNIGKALSKTGFVRGGTTGRHVRWAIPTDLETDASYDGSDDDEASQDAKSGGSSRGDDSDRGSSDDDDGDNDRVQTGGDDENAAASSEDEGGDEDNGSSALDLRDESIDREGDPETMSSSMALKDIENVPVEALLKTMTSAIRANQWDRKLQMIGTAISNHAVLASARSQEMKDIAMKEGGVARAEVMKWIAESPLYSEWVTQMLSKMEVKSYQSNIGKALSKTGFVRTGTTGRHVRWALPTNLETGENSLSDEEESSLEQKSEASLNRNRSNGGSSDSNDDNDDNDDGVGGDSDNLGSSDVEDEVDGGANSMDVQDESEEQLDASGADESLDEDDANADEAEVAENSGGASHSSQEDA